MTWQAGTAGELIARKVADRLGFRFLDQEILAEAAEAAGVATEVLAEAEHPASLGTRLLDALAASPGLPDPGTYGRDPAHFMRTVRVARYRALIDAMVAELPGRGRFVVAGHASQLVLAHRWDTLKVLITGSRQSRTVAVRCQYGLDEEAAARFLDESDRERARYLRERPHRVQDWLAPELYDLSINTEHISWRRAVQIIRDEAAGR